MENPGKIEWTDAAHFQINYSVRGVGHLVSYKFLVQGGEIHEVGKSAN